MFFGGGGGGFPFGGMGDDDDTPGFLGGRGGPQKAVDTQKYYDLLGIQKTASTADIKKAFRTKARTEHPDKGGSEAKFQEINMAHEVLADPEKRKLYDKYGEDGVKDGGGAHSAGFGDIFDMFGMGGGGRGGG